MSAVKLFLLLITLIISEGFIKKNSLINSYSQLNLQSNLQSDQRSNEPSKWKSNCVYSVIGEKNKITLRVIEDIRALKNKNDTVNFLDIKEINDEDRYYFGINDDDKCPILYKDLDKIRNYKKYLNKLNASKLKCYDQYLSSLKKNFAK